MTRRRRLFSSDEVVAALVRAGFSEARRTGSSHRAYVKPMPHGGRRTVIVVQGEHEIKRGTLDSILEQAGMTYEEFELWARVRKKRRRR